MKNNKIFILLFLFVGILVFAPQSVKAGLDVNIYNGDSTSSPNRFGTSKDCLDEFNRGIYFCRFKLTAEARGIRISFVYYDGSSYHQMGRSMDIWKTDPYGTKGLKSAGSIKTSGGGSFSEGYQYWKWSELVVNGSSSAKFESFFKNQERMEIYSKALTGCSLSDMSESCYGKPHEPADPTGKKPATKGYRFFIEPIRGYATKNDGFYVMTLTEFARFAKTSGKKVRENHYVEEDLLFTKFDDIGIKKTAGCQALGSCITTDVMDIHQGHALQIIDFLKPTQCTYEIGKGFSGTGYPQEGVTKEELGRELTDQEKECCNIAKNKIKELGDIKVDSTMCMDASKTVPEFITCMQNYFILVQKKQGLLAQQQQAYKELYEKYPACGCDYDEVEKINKDYNDCIKNGNVSEWISSLISGVQTSCEIDRTSSISEFYAYNSKEICGDLLPDCPFEECPWLPDGSDPNDPNKPNPDDPNKPTPGTPCDENDPNSFPKPGATSEADKYCCYEFEEKMKVQYEVEGLQKGLTGEALQVYIKTNVEAWFSEKEFRLNCLGNECNINDEKLSEECCEILQEEYTDKEKYDDEFWEEKGCSKPNPCTWQQYTDPLIENLKSMAGAVCAANNKNVTISSDTENWDCIFESDNIIKGKELLFKDYYVKYNNPYCAVYCREDIEYQFPAGELPIRAGYHFTVGKDSGHSPEWSPIHFKSTRTCRTSGSTNDDAKQINYGQFSKDWASANNNVIRAWDKWKVTEERHWAVANAYIGGDCGAAGDLMVPPHVEYTYFDFKTGGPAKNPTNVTPSPWCTGSRPPRYDVGAAREYYNYTVNVMETIEDDILACTSWDYFDTYRHPEIANISHEGINSERYSKYQTYNDLKEYQEFEPDLTIDYVEPTHSEYNYKDLLEKEEIPTVADEYFNDEETITSQSHKYRCINKGTPRQRYTCTKSRTFEYYLQEEANATYVKEYDYKMKKNVFDTILKPQGIAVSGNSIQSSNQIRIKLGYSALHIHFMTPSGVYGHQINNSNDGRLDLLYPGFTPIEGAENGFEHNFDHSEFEIGDYVYDCTYRVLNEIIENKDPECVGDNCLECTGDNCDPYTLKGLNLIYRPISLAEPFPGIEGEGRAPGSNWSSNEDIEAYITKNRGVEGTKIYSDKLPMYQITLTPALIQQIRKYNSTTTYNDFNMDCTENGRECKSYFIRETVEEYDFSKQFEKCSKVANKEESTCCGIGNWTDCDKIDEISRRY